MKKFEAVSGDQSLFELVGASDDELYIRKYRIGNGLIAEEKINGNTIVIAERKPIEKYVPKVGDEFKVDNLSSELKCVFIDKFGIVYGEIGGVLLDFPIYKHEFTKIDRRPNPVNMVEEKWVPKAGNVFNVTGRRGDFICETVRELIVYARRPYGDLLSFPIDSEFKKR